MGRGQAWRLVCGAIDWGDAAFCPSETAMSSSPKRRENHKRDGTIDPILWTENGSPRNLSLGTTNIHVPSHRGRDALPAGPPRDLRRYEILDLYVGCLTGTQTPFVRWYL